MENLVGRIRRGDSEFCGEVGTARQRRFDGIGIMKIKEIALAA